MRAGVVIPTTEGWGSGRDHWKPPMATSTTTSIVTVPATSRRLIRGRSLGLDDLELFRTRRREMTPELGQSLLPSPCQTPMEGTRTPPAPVRPVAARHRAEH